ncbi:type II toxin-antitoxin system RelE/ParE family toxin [Priestia aryabhattai]|uniref:type II toxin-antitoxin system RelE/ParE family toxin n=1 Tax=Priestia aryabhattai TaxID=412384 RepID=UPI003D271E1D
MALTYSSTPKMEQILKKVEKRNKHLYSALLKKRELIINSPTVGKKLKGDLNEFRCLDFTFQTGEIRICYTYDEKDEHIVFIYWGTRENFYDKLKNYIK